MIDKMTAHERARQCNKGLKLLREARDLFKAAQAVKVVPRISHAIKSAEGAARHADLRTYRD